ncbi:MAG: glycogen/starch/alpha-glucan phosphorylase [Tissierellia bacterium]|nr:glycogen/starch/alpha-glucan phosphorylase [Tissierellia bacterium]
MDKNKFKERYKDNIIRKYSRDIENTTNREKYNALCDTVMEEINKKWIKSRKDNQNQRKAFYFSAEFLVGRSLASNLMNMGYYNEVKEALDEMGLDLYELEDNEEDAALGNGGLGRLAACFMDSAASEDLNLHGYGVRYSEGIFKQEFSNGFQKEEGDSWLKDGDGWSIRVDSDSKIVRFRNQTVKAVPYDMPIVGYNNDRINTLRLWQSEAIVDFDFSKFNNFEYDNAVSEKNRAEDITRVLYPNDMQRAGKVLRLKQQYFFCSASMQDIVDKYKKAHPEDSRFKEFSKYHVFQLNDTHPVIAIPELMRILMDENSLSWNEAIKIAKESFAFTNHTILSEALEKWPVDIVMEVSPRCKDIIFEIDRRMKEEFLKNSMDNQKIKSYEIVHDGIVEMAYLAIYISFSVNGVAALHTDILKKDTLKNWYEIYPQKFNNKTNGVTPRRWLILSNHELSDFITKKLETEEWKNDLTLLEGLKKYQDDKDTLDELMEIKHQKKIELSKYIKKHENVDIDPNSIFDIQIKRIHEYKRQHLNLLHIIYLYHKLKKNPNMDFTPTTFILGGKAAPGYFRAKGIIKLSKEVSNLVNNDSDVNKKLKVIFIKNYRVSYGEKLFPAADVSEQISTAGKEASGTGNMKFMMNAALTLGTLDGANIEIFDLAGEENNFRFGATVEELDEISSSYNPKDYYYNDPDLKEAVDTLMSGEIDDNGSYMFLDIYNELVNPQNGHRGDSYYLLKDFDSYRKTQEFINKSYRDKYTWAKKALINLSMSGYFSSDRTIREYAMDIWHI